MSYHKRYHSQNNDIYQNILQSTKRSNLRNRSLCKPLLFEKECFRCISQSMIKQQKYQLLQIKKIKLNFSQQRIQQIKLTNIQQQMIVLQRWCNKILMKIKKIKESNIMYKFYQNHKKSLNSFQNVFILSYYQLISSLKQKMKAKPIPLLKSEIMNQYIPNIQLPHKQIFVEPQNNHRFHKLIYKRSISQDEINYKKKKIAQKLKNKQLLKLKSQSQSQSQSKSKQTINPKSKMYHQKQKCFCFTNLLQQLIFQEQYIHFYKCVFNNLYNKCQYYKSLMSQSQKPHRLSNKKKIIYYNKEQAFALQLQREQCKKQYTKIKIYYQQIFRRNKFNFQKYYLNYHKVLFKIMTFRTLIFRRVALRKITLLRQISDATRYNAEQ